MLIQIFNEVLSDIDSFLHAYIQNQIARVSINDIANKDFAKDADKDGVTY